jgi:hypothetical protein
MSEGKCAFRKGHTTLEGKQQSPERCKQALLEKYKMEIEVCHVKCAEECPVKAFTPEPGVV